MLIVNDDYFSKNFFDACYQAFDASPIFSNSKGKRFTVCIKSAPIWVALCFYLKEKGGSIFPLPEDTPNDAAMRRAEKSQSHYLLVSIDNEIKPSQLQHCVSIISHHTDDQVPALIQMSSGTTGDPKVIVRAWSSIEVEMDAYLDHFPEANDYTPIIAAPISHSYGLICGVLVAFRRGVTPILIQNLNPKYLIRKIFESEKPILYSSPTLITTLTMLVKEESPIHAIMTSGTLMQPQWFEKVKKKCSYLYQQYGCSEAGCISLGKNIRSYNEIGQLLPHHEGKAGKDSQHPDELIISNDREGRIDTKDLCYFDEENSLHFVSRLDDMINVSGMNVYPGEVEEVVLELEGIQDAVVFKRSHSFGNDQVCLHFVADKPIQDNIIRRWCGSYLAPYQIPMHIIQVDEIAKLPNGKIKRKALSEAV